jgi:hypothetical protein
MPYPMTTNSAAIAARRGATGGILGALVMAGLAMIVMALAGKGFWTPPRLIAGVVLDNVLTAGAGAVVLGVVIHLITGAAFGGAFGAIFYDRTPSAGALMGWGLAYGAIIYFVMTFLVLPWANPVMYANFDLSLLFLDHLVFGACVAGYLAATHRIEAAAVHSSHRIRY